MPELPEVEVTRLGFADAIAGAAITQVLLGKPLRWPLGIAPDALAGVRVRQVRRRGKYLLLDLSEGLLLIHLGMSGSLRFFSSQAPAPAAMGPHDHFEMRTDRGVLRLHDPRRFGAVIWVADEDAPLAGKLLCGLGVEPLSDGFQVDAFAARLKASRQSIKQVLLAGKVVVGVGNIYASEALFAARIRPTALAARLSRERVRRLHGAVRDILARAVERGGSTLRDFSGAGGDAGHFQLEARVYGRAGLPCLECGTPIRMLRQGQRSTFYCPHCQKR